MLGRFDAVLIDFYGTLCAGDRHAVETACARVVEHFRLAETAEAFARRWGASFFSLIESSNHDGFRTLHECECLSLRQTLEPAVGEFDPEPFVAVLKQYWCSAPLHDDVRDALARIRLPRACVSNADAGDLARVISLHGLEFDAVVTSEDARSYKPDAAIFRRAIEALGVDPSRVLHVGDSLHSDIGGARPLGITTVWLHRQDRVHDVGTAVPDYTIRSLCELPALLNGAGCGDWL